MAVLKIYAPIVNDDEKVILQYMGFDGISYKSIDEFLSSMDGTDNEIDMRLHCEGGSVFEGWAIHDRLRASGKHITATIEGNCASMATILLLAASDRRAAPHATILIHDPFVSLCDNYTADELAKVGNDLETQRNKILDYYVERTGTDRKTLDKMMREETIIDMEQAKELGFINEIIAPISASAYRTKILKNMANRKNFIQRLLGAITSVVDDEAQVCDYTLNTADGGEIHLEKESGDPCVGDKCSPDGEHLMPNGQTFVVSGGVLTEIRQPDSNAGEDSDRQPEPQNGGQTVEQLLAQVDDLTSQLASLNAENESLTNELNALRAENEAMRPRLKSELETEILNLVTVAGGSLEGGRAWLADAKSNFKPTDRQVTRDAKPVQGASPITEKLIEAKKANGIRVDAE